MSKSPKVQKSKRPNVQFQGFLLIRRREPLGPWTFKPTLPWLRHRFIFCKLPVKARFYVAFQNKTPCLGRG